MCARVCVCVCVCVCVYLSLPASFPSIWLCEKCCACSTVHCNKNQSQPRQLHCRILLKAPPTFKREIAAFERLSSSMFLSLLASSDSIFFAFFSSFAFFSKKEKRKRRRTKNESCTDSTALFLLLLSEPVSLLFLGTKHRNLGAACACSRVCVV